MAARLVSSKTTSANSRPRDGLERQIPADGRVPVAIAEPRRRESWLKKWPSAAYPPATSPNSLASREYSRPSSWPARNRGSAVTDGRRPHAHYPPRPAR